jgi:hypothetical protein
MGNAVRGLHQLRAIEIDALMRRGLKKLEMRNDQNAILSAIYEFLDETLSYAVTRNRR